MRLLPRSSIKCTALKCHRVHKLIEPNGLYAHTVLISFASAGRQSTYFVMCQAISFEMLARRCSSSLHFICTLSAVHCVCDRRRISFSDNDRFTRLPQSFHFHCATGNLEARRQSYLFFDFMRSIVSSMESCNWLALWSTFIISLQCQ